MQQQLKATIIVVINLISEASYPVIFCVCVWEREQKRVYKMRLKIQTQYCGIKVQANSKEIKLNNLLSWLMGIVSYDRLIAYIKQQTFRYTYVCSHWKNKPFFLFYSNNFFNEGQASRLPVPVLTTRCRQNRYFIAFHAKRKYQITDPCNWTIFGQNYLYKYISNAWFTRNILK